MKPGDDRGVLSLFKELPRQLLVVLVIIFFNSYKYFTLATVLSLFATNEYGLSDVEAGRLYGFWGLFHSVWGFVGSFLVDLLGIRAVALVATTLGVVSRGLLVFSDSLPVMRFVLMGLGPMAEGICDPLYMVAIKKLTRRRIRAFAFSTQYAFMNLGGAVGENLTDLLRGQTWKMPWGAEYSGLRFVLFTTWLAADGCWLLAWFVREPKQSTVAPAPWSPAFDGNAFNQQASAGFVADLHPSPPSSPEASPRNASREEGMTMSLLVEELPEGGAKPPVSATPPAPEMSSQAEQRSWLQKLRTELAAYNAGGSFARAVLLTSFVMFVSLQWRYMDTLLPKFAERSFGVDCPWGGIYSINSWMCVLCPPLVSALTPGDKYDDFSLIVPGLWLMALSPAVIALSVSEGTTALWVFLLSCGEVLWSPRSQSFIASLAPNGREGAFLALAAFPTFFSQYPVGIVSGWLLESYCPGCPKLQNEACRRDPSWRGDPGSMWLWVAGTSAVSPLLVSLSVRYLRRGQGGGGADEDED